MKNLAFKLLDLALVRNSKLDLQELSPWELLNQVKVASESKLKEKDAVAYQYFPNDYDGSWDYHPVTANGVG